MSQNDLTKREWFAGQALVGILSNPSWNQLALMGIGVSEREAIKVCGRVALMYADSIMDALEREKKND